MDVRKYSIIDLHLHLDGALTMESVKDLAKINGMKLPNDENLRKELTVSENCRDLNEFLDKFAFIKPLLQTKETISRAVYNLLEENRQRGLMYAEVRFAPSRSCDLGLTQEEVVEAALEGMKQSSLPANLILCMMRGESEEINRETMRLTKKYLGKGVVALDLAGAEILFPNVDYDYLFKEALALNIPLTIHAGEAGWADSVWAAIYGGATRIGHGVHSYVDEALMDELVRRGVVLELCPTSNLNTQAVADLGEYPLRTFMNKGVKFCINTDDPGIEGTILEHELQILVNEFNLSEEELKQIILTGIECSHASEELKEKMRKAL